MQNTLFMLVIGLFFGTGIGFLVAQGVEAPDSHDHASHGAPHDDAGPVSTPSHDHSAMIELTGDLPKVTAEVTAEPGGLNIHILTQNFRFAPEHVNSPHVDGEGHAHVYLNGVKMMRAYGPWVNLGGLPAGPAALRITLNANSHEALAHGGVPIEYITTVTVE